MDWLTRPPWPLPALLAWGGSWLLFLGLQRVTTPVLALLLVIGTDPWYAPQYAIPLFGMVLGLGGLANGWRTAARLWGWSGIPGEALALLAATTLAVGFSAWLAGRTNIAHELRLGEER